MCSYCLCSLLLTPRRCFFSGMSHLLALSFPQLRVPKPACVETPRGRIRDMTPPDPIDVEAALERRVDPVSEADAYREMLLGLLGERDPAEIQAQLTDQLQAVVEEAGPRLRIRPAPSEWSVLEVLGHILDAEIVSAGRYRWILAHDEPPLIGYDQDLWVDRLHDQSDDPAEMLELLGVLRRSHLQLWARTPESDRARFG